MPLALSIVLCGGIGWAIVSTAWRIEASPAAALLKGFLSAGFGLGAFSVLLVLFRSFGGHSLWAVDAVVFLLLLIGLFLLRRRAKTGRVLLSEDLLLPHWLHHVLRAGFALSLSAALYGAIRRVIALPNGEGWDAFAIWNLHARFLVRGGPAWRDGFSPLIPWSHPDYPLLIPGAIAHFWTLAGSESQAVPAVIGLVFTISTGGLLFSGLRILRGLNVAVLGSMALIATPAFIEQGTSQYADVPLSFFLLATVVLVRFDDAVVSESSGAKGLLGLAGLALSFGAWVKNEGLLFLLALVVGWIVVTIADRRRNQTAATKKPHGRAEAEALKGAIVSGEVTAQRKSDPSEGHETQGLSGTGEALLFETMAAEPPARPRGSWIAPLLLAALPALAVVMWFKHFVAPPGDLFGSAASMLGKVLSENRYGAVARWFLKQFFRFGHWLWIPGTVLVLGLDLVLGRVAAPTENALAGLRRGRHDIGATSGFRTSVAAILITLAGYFLIYVITPYDVYWHLRFSLNRLFLQLWPSVIFLCFLRLRARRSTTTESQITSK